MATNCQVYQAISKVILDAQSSGVINTPPPIVGRIYQEMGLGMRTFQCAMPLGLDQSPFRFRKGQFGSSGEEPDIQG